MDRLKTTADDYDAEAKEAMNHEHPRSFVWTAVDEENNETWDGIANTLRAHGLEVLDVLPHWHVLACAPDTQVAMRRRMVKTFINCMKGEEAAFRGAMFGYPTEDVRWYLGQLEKAKDRAFRYLEETKGGDK